MMKLVIIFLRSRRYGWSLHRRYVKEIIHRTELSPQFTDHVGQCVTDIRNAVYYVIFRLTVDRYECSFSFLNRSVGVNSENMTYTMVKENVTRKRGRNKRRKSWLLCNLKEEWTTQDARDTETLLRSKLSKRTRTEADNNCQHLF